MQILRPRFVKNVLPEGFASFGYVTIACMMRNALLFGYDRIVSAQGFEEVFRVRQFGGHSTRACKTPPNAVDGFGYSAVHRRYGDPRIPSTPSQRFRLRLLVNMGKWELADHF